MLMDKLDRPSLSVVINCYVSVFESGKLKVKWEGKSGKTIHRVLFPTQICQFWDTEEEKCSGRPGATSVTSYIF